MPPSQHRVNLPRRLAAWTLAVLLMAAPGRADSDAACGTVGAVRVRAMGEIGLTVADLEREVAFFTEVLAFEVVGRGGTARGAVDAWLGLDETELRTAELQLGDERIRLTEHRGRRGRPWPADSRSCDHWFQHLAIVVRDLDKAYAALRRQGVRHISTGPQTLPAWNREAGGIRAFYFRDPEDHPLELIWFPRGKGDPRWHRPAPASRLFLGIDHTAIVVGDTARSLAFYRDALGFRVAGTAENYGPEQEHLNQVFGARVRITALRAPYGPGLELLEYLAPPGGRPLPAGSAANDLVFWQTGLRIDALAPTHAAILAAGGSDVSRHPVTPPFPGGEEVAGGSHAAERSLIVRDPDGHALELREHGKFATGP